MFRKNKIKRVRVHLALLVLCGSYKTTSLGEHLHFLYICYNTVIKHKDGGKYEQIYSDFGG